MKEYRIQAYFKTNVYQTRSYKRRIYGSRKDAEKDLKDAIDYYNTHPYENHIDYVAIEERIVTKWKKTG